MRVLFLTQRLPYAPNRGDRVRAYHQLRVLTARHEVHLVSFVHDDEEESHQGDLGVMAASVTAVRVPRLRNLARASVLLSTRRPLTHVLLDSPAIVPALHRLVQEHRPELVLAFCSSMARFALEPPLAGLPFVLDMVDVDSEKWRALANTTPPPKRWIYARESRLLGRFEGQATQKAVLTCVVNDREAASLRALAGETARILVLQNGVDLEHLRPRDPPVKSMDVVFCGVMDYTPNEEGALWLAGEVWPRVIAERPDARLVLMGANPTPRLLRLARSGRSIVVTGSVPDVRPHLWQSAVSAAPLRVARGVQNKVLEAAAAGLPVVITSVVAAGLPAEVMPACTTADSADAFARALLDRLSLQPAERRALAASAHLDAISWDRRLAPLVEAVEHAAAGPVHGPWTEARQRADTGGRGSKRI